MIQFKPYEWKPFEGHSCCTFGPHMMLIVGNQLLYFRDGFFDSVVGAFENPRFEAELYFDKFKQEILELIV